MKVKKGHFGAVLGHFGPDRDQLSASIAFLFFASTPTGPQARNLLPFL